MAWSRASLLLLALTIPTTAQALPTYKEPAPEAYKESTSVIQRAWDDVMQTVSTIAGAPNATTRDDKDAPRLKIKPTAADRAAKDTLDFAADVGGARGAYKSEEPGFPRRPLITLSERNTASNPAPIVINNTTAQPISIQATVPIQAPTSAPINITAAQPAPTLEPINITTEPSAPVINTNNGPLIMGSAMEEPVTQDVQKAVENEEVNSFFYNQIDQSKTLTTPMIGNSEKPAPLKRLPIFK